MTKRVKEIINKLKTRPRIGKSVSDMIGRTDPKREQIILDLAKNVINLQEACRITKLTDKTLRKELKDGRLTGVLIGGPGGRWLIPLPALEEFLKLRRSGTGKGSKA